MKTAQENFPERLLSQKRHPVRQKLLSVLLCACLLLVSLPMEGYGSEVQAEKPQKKVLSFSELPEEVKYQTVEPGTSLEELNLPETLEAVCVPAGQDSNGNPETLVQPEGSPEAKGTAPEVGSLPEETQEVSQHTEETEAPKETQEVSGDGNSEVEPPAENEAEEPESPAENGSEEQPESPTPDSEPGTEEVPEMNQEAGPETDTDSNSNSEETVVIERVTWTGTPAYDSETEGVYVFAPVLPEGYVVADGVGLPEVQVTVGKAEVPATSDSSKGESAEENRTGKESEDGTTEKGERLKESRTAAALAEGEEPEPVTPSCGVISEDTTWTKGTLSDGTVTVEEGVTLTIRGTVVITGSVVIEGGGTIIIGTPTDTSHDGDGEFVIGKGSLTMRNITYDGNYGVEDEMIELNDKGIVTLGDGCIIQNCDKRAINVSDGGTLIVGKATAKNCSTLISMFNSTLEMKGAVVTDCSERGIYIRRSNAVINETTIENCSTEFKGGAINIEGSEVEINKTIIKNCSGDRGGAINAENDIITSRKSTLELRDTVIENCESDNGGAIYISGATLNIHSGIYRNNRSTKSAGGFLEGIGEVNIYGGEFLGNSSVHKGGCIDHRSGNCNIYGGVFRGNTSSYQDDTGDYRGSGAICQVSFDSMQEAPLVLSGDVRFCGDGVEDSGTDGIYLSSKQDCLSRKILLKSRLAYPLTAWLKAVDHYVIVEGTDGYSLTENDLRKTAFVDVGDSGEKWYKKLDTATNQIYLTKVDPGYGFRIFYYNVDGKVTDNTKYSSGTSATIQSVDGLADPIPNQEKFLGWCENEDGTGKIYEGGETVMMTKDLHLYPVYKKKTLSADFYSGGPGPSETRHEEQKVEEDVESVTITVPALQNFPDWTPLGWTESAAAYESTIEAGGECTLTEDGKKYYGVYQKEVTLTYDSADDIVTAEVIMPGAEKALRYANVHEAITYQDAVFTLPSGPEVPGYTFKGWSEQADGSGTLHEAGTKYSIQEDDTLYAVYEEKAKKTFTADFYSGSLCQPETVTETVEEPAASAEIIAPSLQAMEGWEAVGWERESPSLYNGDVKPNDIITLNKDKTDFYGIYQKEVTLTYDSTDKAITAGISMPEAKKALCYANVHKDEITCPGTDFTLASGPEVSGYTFKGWSEQENGSGTLHEVGTKYSIQENDTLYAVYEEKGKRTFTADFYSGNPLQIKSESDIRDEDATEGTVTVPSPETITGWTFLGWNKNKGAYTADTDIRPGHTLTLTEDKTEYYGIYETEITLTYNANGGDSTPPEDIQKRYANVHEATEYREPDFTIAPAIRREGHTFVEWNTKADGSGTSFEPGSTRKLDENTLLYAVWKETSTAPEPSDPTGPSEPEPSGPGTLAPETALYQVEYYCQNLAGEEYTRMDSDTELLTGTVGTEVEASRKNYTGFTLNLSHPSGKQKGTVEGDGSLVLKLYYDRIVYEVDFNLNGGYGKAPDTQKIRYGGLLNPVSDPLRRGYNFKGWYMDDKGMDGGIWDFGSPVEHNTGTLHTTLYAKWADELAPEMGKASFSRGSRDFLDWLIQKKSMVITVPVTEEGSGLSKAEYLLVAEDGTEQEGQAAFTETHTPDTMAAYGSSAAVIRSIRGEAEKGSYEARIAIEEEFKGKVYLTCTDHAGNVSPQKTLTAEGGGVIVEDNAPEIRFEGTEETTGGKPLEIKVKVRDNREDRVTSGIAGIRYQADKGKKVTLPEEDFAGDFAEACEFTVKIKGEGKHTLRVEAEDQAGNESAAEVTLNISGKREVPAEVPGDSEPGNPGRPGRPLGGEPKTGDSTQIQICATLAMIAGFGYLLLYFEGENGITEEEKEEIIYRMVTWAKQGGRIRRLLGLAGIFLFLAYYHSIGKSVDVEWKEVYGRN